MSDDEDDEEIGMIMEELVGDMPQVKSVLLDGELWIKSDEIFWGWIRANGPDHCMNTFNDLRAAAIADLHLEDSMSEVPS